MSFNSFRIKLDTIFRRIDVTFDAEPVLQSMLDGATSLSHPEDFEEIRKRMRVTLAEVVLAEVIDQIVESPRFQFFCRTDRTAPTTKVALERLLNVSPPCPAVLNQLYGAHLPD